MGPNQDQLGLGQKICLYKALQVVWFPLKSENHCLCPEIARSLNYIMNYIHFTGQPSIKGTVFSFANETVYQCVEKSVMWTLLKTSNSPKNRNVASCKTTRQLNQQSLPKWLILWKGFTLVFAPLSSWLTLSPSLLSFHYYLAGTFNTPESLPLLPFLGCLMCFSHSLDEAAIWQASDFPISTPLTLLAAMQSLFVEVS